MSTKVVISPRTAIAPLGAGVLRSLRVEFRPICDGRELASPDGRFIARATSIYAPRDAVRSESRYDFAVDDRAGRRIQQIEIPAAREELINWRLEGSITWAGDGSSVTFHFNRTTLTLVVDDKGRNSAGHKFNEMENRTTYDRA
jgi:hypothetical protein